MQSLLEDLDFLNQSDELVEFYRQYPEIAAEDLLRVKLSSIQKVVLRSMWFRDYVMAIMCRGAGKTFLLAVFSCLKAMLYPGHRVGLLAPTFRQSKYIFDECDKLYHRSPVLQAACERKPTSASDNCYLRFKAVGTKNPSVIQAIPLGDGTKIRGSRFFTILCDEFPHIPDEIFNMVIRPMAATLADPMENVEKVSRQKELLERGLITQADIDADTATNQIIITSSGYFTFNHMYKLYCAYKEEMRTGNGKYAVFRVPYWLLPDGFLDKKAIEAAKREMSSLEFRMEYEAAFIPDTDAFYKASLLEACSRTGFSTRVAGEHGKTYCLGIDPARSEDSFAIAIAELGVPAKIVHALELQKQPFPRMAELIEDLCDAFNVQHIYMDAGGGGLAIKDILAENNRGHRAGPILDPEDEAHQVKSGRHIIKMCNFGVDFISESNFAALRLLENRDLLFPSVPVGDTPTPAEEEGWDKIQEMKRQMQMISLSETPTGKYHFDVPKGEGHGKQKKDLYTSFMLAARCVYDHLWAHELAESVLFHGGVLRPREDRASRPVINSDGVPVDDAIPQVIRDKLEMAQDPVGFKQRLMQRAFNKRTLLTSPYAVLKPVPKKKK